MTGREPGRAVPVEAPEPKKKGPAPGKGLMLFLVFIGLLLLWAFMGGD